MYICIIDNQLDFGITPGYFFISWYKEDYGHWKSKGKMKKIVENRERLVIKCTCMLFGCCRFHPN